MALDIQIEERVRPHWSRGTFRSLRHRNFQLFLGGQMISVIGSWMQTVAQSWLVYRMTGSSLLLGTVAFASQFPIFVFAPGGGLMADRWNRQKVVIETQTASMILAFILAALTLTHHVTVREIVVLAALLGVVNAVDIPVRQAFLIEMVDREDLMNAIALNSSMFNGARIVGPAIAGILVAAIGEGWCFFANAVSYIAVITGLFLMRIENPNELEKKESALDNLVRRVSIRARDAADLGVASADWVNEFCGHAVLRADAYLRGSYLAWGSAGARLVDGRNGSGRFVWCSHAGDANGSERPREVGGGVRGGVRREPDYFRLFEVVLDVAGHSCSDRLRHDAPNGLHKYSRSGHVSRPAARTLDGALHHDDGGHGAVRSFVRGSVCG